MAAADIRPGDPVLFGLLYRWIPNTELSFDYKGKKPGKVAFRPDRGETGISVFRADLTRPQDVIDGLEGYGVCEFTAEQFLTEVGRLRASDENDFDQEVTIEFDPTTEHPRAGHAHCYVKPMPALIQKALYRRVSRMTDGYLPGPAVAGRSTERDSPGS